MPPAPIPSAPHGSRGQASLLLVAGLAGIAIAAVIFGVVARAVGREAGAQRAACGLLLFHHGSGLPPRQASQGA